MKDWQFLGCLRVVQSVWEKDKLIGVMSQKK